MEEEIVTVHEKDPVPETVAPQLEIVAPAVMVVATETPTVNPVPLTSTDVPVGPWPGVRVIAGVETVNVPVAVCPPASVATTEVPLVPAGTVSVHETSPELPAVRLPDVQCETVTLSNTSEVSGVYSEKPEPETVTLEPSGPEFADRPIAGVVMVKVAAADASPVATSVPTTLYGPALKLGTANLHANAPLGSVVIVGPLEDPTEQLVGDWSTESNDTSADEETEKPVPFTE